MGAKFWHCVWTDLLYPSESIVCPLQVIPPNATLVFDVELISFS